MPGGADQPAGRLPLPTSFVIDLTIIDPRRENPTSICRDSRPHGDWDAMDYDRLMSGPRSITAATLILAGIPREDALRRATAVWQ